MPLLILSMSGPSKRILRVSCSSDGWALPQANSMIGNGVMARSMSITAGFQGIFGLKPGKKKASLSFSTSIPMKGTEGWPL